MHLLVEHRLSYVANLGSPGLDELRFLKPVHPGDELRVRLTILEVWVHVTRDAVGNEFFYDRQTLKRLPTDTLTSPGSHSNLRKDGNPYLRRQRGRDCIGLFVHHRPRDNLEKRIFMKGFTPIQKTL